MKRIGLVTCTVAAMGALLATPALAKGPLVPIPGTVVISGPGLSSPIVLQGNVYWYENTPTEPEAAHNRITLVARQLGFLDAGPEVGWYELPPNPRALGPAYNIEYTLDAKEFGGVTGFGPSVPLGATLYPYAIDQWWSAPPALRTWLVSQGLPATAPTLRVAAAPRPGPQLPPPERFPWGIAFAATALLAMIVAAAVAGRRAELGR